MEREYTEICEFTYKNKRYLYLLDDNHKAFFLRKDNDTLNYITIDELIDLQKAFTKNTHVLNFKISKEKKSKKRRIIPKILIGGILVTLTTNIAGIFSKKNTYTPTIENTISSTEETNEEDIPYEIQKYMNDEKLDEELVNNNYKESSFINEEDIPYDIQKYMYSEKLDEELVVENYKESSFMNYVYIYDMSALSNVLDEQVTFDTLKKTVQNNDKISQKYKNYLYEYIDNLASRWPNVDIRTFNENLKTIEFIEYDKYKLLLKTLDENSFACYRKDENKIYLLDDLDMNDPWTKQVVYHEISHSLRSAYWSKDGKNIRVQFTDSSGYGFEIEEALNSLFALSLYDENEKNIAYHLQSNYMKTILECMDNYTLEDYVNHNYTYFEQCLNETNNNDLAKKVLSLIELQHKDFYNDDFKVEQEQYEPIYTYITDMYLDKYATNSMSLEEINGLVEELKEQVMFNVSEKYEIDTSYFDMEGYNYYQELEKNKDYGQSR